MNRRPVYDIDCVVPQAIVELEPANDREVIAREILIALSELCELTMCGIIRKANVVTVSLRVSIHRKVSFHVKLYGVALSLKLDTDTESKVEWDDFAFCDPGFLAYPTSSLLQLVERMPTV